MSTAQRMVEQARTLINDPTVIGVFVIAIVGSICLIVPLPG